MSSTVADLYDPSDVAFGAQPRLMCAACGKREVGIYEPVCPECRKSLEQAGILKPLIGGRFYDIRGEVLADDKWIPFTDQRAFNRAYLWGKPQP